MFFEKVQEYYNLNKPFVVYKKPHESKAVGLFQKSKKLHTLADVAGFCWVNFNNDNKYCIPETDSDIYVTQINQDTLYVTPSANLVYDEKAKSSFEAIVSKAIDTINTGTLEKVVLSRKEILDKNDIDIVLTLQKLFSFYPDAFTYVLYHPELGVFMGASPEQFIEVEHNTLHTVALAGTQTYHEGIITWQPKEVQEQQIVTQYIENSLKPYAKQLIISKPFTQKAGNLAHIKTQIECLLHQEVSIENICDTLHPTPAVCGFPKDKAKQFILENEGYDRAFYSGYIGEWKKNFYTYTENSYDLYVNLRCAKIDEATHIYVGCGITKDSNPEKEFFETVHKSQTIKKCM